MDPYSRHLKIGDYHNSDLECHDMTKRFCPSSGDESREVLEGHNCNGPENENNCLLKPPEASQAWDDDGGSLVINVPDLGFSIAPPPTQPVDESIVQDVMGAKELRENPGLEPKTGTSVKKSIKENIKKCLVYNQSNHGLKGKRFLPIDKLDMILSVESIKALLQEEYSRMTKDDLRSKLDVYLSRRRILGILLFMYPDHLRLFEFFVSECITDVDLPLASTGSADESSFRTRLGEENTTMFKKWKDNDITLFYSYQPIFLAPFFDIQGNRLCSYSLNEAIRLPWLKCELKTRGGNGMVHMVEIHPSHHNFKSYQPGSPLYFALKEIPTLDADTYRQELLALEKSYVQMQKERHLIKLLLTFQHGQKYYFLFEWADGNLWDYWKKHPKGSEEAIVNSVWMARQCLGLATAVKRIHGLATWQKERRDKLGVKNEDKKEWGRHGDIKPHNILWFSSYRSQGCFLVLSDLGLTRYHSSVTRSRVSPNSLDGCTELYRPPEMDMPGQHVCSKYDIWSLGCVFLEFCTWWLRGLRFVEDFETQRARSDDSIKILDDPKYFFISKANNDNKPQVKGIVIEWIRDLRVYAKGDLFAEPMLDLIENNMLVVNKEDRFSADLVCTEISNIVRRLQNTDTESASSSALLPSPNISVSGNCNGLLKIYTEGTGNSRLVLQQKKGKTGMNNSVLHTENYWDSRSSNHGPGSTTRNSSSYANSSDPLNSLMAGATISFDSSKHESRIENQECQLKIVQTSTIIENTTIPMSARTDMSRSSKKEERYYGSATRKWLRSVWARIRRQVK